MHISGMGIAYLPPYSPDMNPIEEAFSAIKVCICANWDQIQGELSGDGPRDVDGLIWQAVYNTVTFEKVQGWYHDCGYEY